MARKGILWAVAPQAAILGIIQPKFTERVFAHHMTVAFGVTEEEVKDLIGREVTVKVAGSAHNGEIQALVIDPPMWLAKHIRNRHPHITISSNGAAPVKSNDMLASEDTDFFLYDLAVMDRPELAMRIEWSPFK